MNTNKVYIASLRVALNHVSKGFFQQYVSHEHKEYVLIKTNDMEKFKDLRTGKKYRNYFRYNNYEAIDMDSIRPFNEMVGNTKKYMTKRKILKLYDKIK